MSRRVRFAGHQHPFTAEGHAALCGRNAKLQTNSTSNNELFEVVFKAAS
jgi:hypothetical protein